MTPDQSVDIATSRDDTLSSLVVRVPNAGDLAAGTTISLTLAAPSSFAKLFGVRGPAPRHARASALLARGFRDIRAHVGPTGEDVVRARA